MPPSPAVASFGFSVYAPASSPKVQPVPLPVSSPCCLPTSPVPVRDFKGQAGAPAPEVSRWSWVCAACKLLNAGGRRSCSCGEPRAPHPVVASGARWTPNAIARWDRGHQRERRRSLPPPVTKVAWLPPEGDPVPPPPGYPPLPPPSIENQALSNTTPEGRESERQQQQAQAKQRQAAAIRQAMLSQAQTKPQQSTQAQEQQQQVEHQQAQTGRGATPATAASPPEPAPAELCDTESDGTYSDCPDYTCPICGVGLPFGTTVSHEEVIPLLCGCTGPPGPK